jgi:hypothetical protein
LFERFATGGPPMTCWGRKSWASVDFYIFFWAYWCGRY